MRRTPALDAALAIALLAGLALVSVWLREETLSGAVRVVDGDSLAFGDRRVRLKGVDAPELAQLCERGTAVYRCGEVARQALRDLVRDRPVLCRSRGRDRYGRTLAVCEAAEVDLAAALVRRGLAVAYGSYEAEERDARARRLGLWAGTFQRPSEWRRDHGGDAEASGHAPSRTP